MNTTASPDPATEELVLRPWVKIAFALLVGGLALGGGRRAYHWASYRAAHAVAEDAVVEGRTVELGPEGTAGRVVRLTAKERDRVAAGQTLVEIEAGPYRERLALAESQLARAEADLAAAESVERSGAEGRSGLEAKLVVETRRSAREDARKAVAVAEQALRSTSINAPFAGVVVRLSKAVGDYVAAGDFVLTLLDPDSLYVAARFDESQLRGVNPGCAAVIQTASDPDPLRGRVLSVLPPSESDGGMGTVRVGFDDAARRESLLPGTPVRLVVERGPGDPAWAERANREMSVREKRGGK